MLALPEAQETGEEPCDTGSLLSELQKEFSDLPVDFNLLHEEAWNAKKGLFGANALAVKKRALFVRRWLRERPEDVIVLVSHGGFLHYLNEDWEGFKEEKGTGWVNCEWRTYEFRAQEGQKDENASLVETTASRERRRGEERELTETEVNELEQLEDDN